MALVLLMLLGLLLLGLLLLGLFFLGLLLFGLLAGAGLLLMLVLVLAGARLLVLLLLGLLAGARLVLVLVLVGMGASAGDIGLGGSGVDGRGADAHGGLGLGANAVRLAVRLTGGHGLLGVDRRRGAGGLDLGAGLDRLFGLGVVLVLHLRGHGRAVAGLLDDLEVDLDASILALDELGVEVPAAMVAGGASVEGGGLLVGEKVVADGEAGISWGALVALLLRGGRGQDAAAVLVVVDVWTKCQWLCCGSLGR